MTPRFFSFLLILALMLPVAHAVGFMSPPSEREFIFTPGSTISIPLTVVNGNNIDVSVASFIPSDPSTLGTPHDDNIMEYVTLRDAAPDSGPRQVTVEFNLPQQLKPGFYEVYVTAAEYPPGPKAQVGAVAMTRMRFTIRVLTDEPLAEITAMQFQPIAEGMPTNVSVILTSRTKQDISRAQAQVDITKDGVIVGTAKSGILPLPSAESVTFQVIVPTEELMGGEYIINSTATYDGKVANGPTDTLKVGTLHVGVPRHLESITYNVTNRFTFSISNEWNKELQEVYATVQLGQTKKTASQNIAPFGETEYEVYFDRDESLLPGQAEVNVTITFKDYDPRTKLYVNKQESFLLPVSVVVPPVVEEEGLDLMTVATFGIIILLFALLIVAIILLARRSRQPAAQQPVPVQQAQPAPVQPAAQPAAPAQPRPSQQPPK